jgi:hypothetical protein
LVIYDARGMKLSHGRLTPYDARNIETKFINPFLKVDKNDIGEHLEPIPASVNDYLAAVPDLARVAHPGLWELMFVNFWLRPSLFF